jgi:Helicase associated domain
MSARGRRELRWADQPSDGTASQSMHPNRQHPEGLSDQSQDPAADQWEEGFSHLQRLSDRVGNCRVPRGYNAEDGYRLGLWIANQRKARATMKFDHRRRLEALPGWSWQPYSDKWEEGFAHLERFSIREGHCRVPAGRKADDDYRLGVWVSVQRRNMDRMSPDRRQRLEVLRGWSWDAYSDKWEEGFGHLIEFSEREGHCRVSQSYKSDDGYRLGQWVSVQRMNENTIGSDRRQRLEALPGWSWDALADKWEEGFHHLKEFLDRGGHRRVLRRHRTEDGYRLGDWISTQRRKREVMEPDRLKRLEALPGWMWRQEN